MDRVVSVKRSFLNEIRGFLNVFARLCSGCFRRPCDCENYITINRAKRLISEIDAVRDADEENYFIENPAEERFARILKAVEQAGRPVRSDEIRLEGVYRQKKFSTIKTMVRRKMLSVTVRGGVKYYEIFSDTDKHTHIQER